MKSLPFTAFASLFLLSALLFTACSTTKPAADQGPSEPSMDATKGLSEEEQELQQLLDRTRDVLADQQKDGQLEVPPVFRKGGSGSGENIQQNPYQGFRIQLISTRDVEKADEVAADFEEWIREVFPAYPAETYVIFQQPSYKVHIGDFQSRTRAIAFTKLVKQKYPGAWIVPDRINPSSIAPDSVSFSTDPGDFK
ncbi:MAG TPA: SPOR domain-containing protein [Fodinibius sp.]|nr:SPOR domain-containing protein [Fodinibius sp.]